MTRELKLEFRDEMIKQHREFWNAFADEIYSKKDKVHKYTFIFQSDKFHYLINYENKCSLCAYSSVIEAEENSSNICSYCYYCPLYDINNKNLSCLNGLYEDFLYATSWQRAAELARKIANLSIVNEIKD